MLKIVGAIVGFALASSAAMAGSTGPKQDATPTSQAKAISNWSGFGGGFAKATAASNSASASSGSFARGSVSGSSSASVSKKN
jgi:hypothetical protein